ncbi:hypothetical protein [Nonomuraea sp. B1E8]|uniref:hypothetical protein n=1 Tax=unclassified Nonomuraea TaxID=2593643 RepID=UPI00325ED797
MRGPGRCAECGGRRASTRWTAGWRPFAEGELVVGLPEFGEATVPHLSVELLRERLGP